ncbi:hypothetical protein T3H97_13330 [Paenibacillus sp. LX16]|uniref:hypothetical protein n=1 Tax=Paenibacillus sp. LX16 TaxID=1740264 RepID=UPI0019F64A31|nr:hypothetical protein [Paenibacillus sp. LX16]KAF6630886.1 hypothetical protein H6F38_15870 [Paenibacillus sp. EKM208P]
MNNTITIGKTGLKAFKLGFGAGVVGNSMMYPKVDDTLSRQLIRTALISREFGTRGSIQSIRERQGCRSCTDCASLAINASSR